MTSVRAAIPGLCDDIDADICSRLKNHYPGMCNVDCVANEVCPRKCGKCMGCYQCNHVTNPEFCTQKTTCGMGEQCFSVETISANSEQGFKLGCMDEKLCSTFGHAAPNIFGKRQGFELSLHGGCCKGEFCNHHTLLPTSTVTTTTSTTTVPTTTVPTTTAPKTAMPTTTQTGCHTHPSTCPQGWIPLVGSCFAIEAPAANWDKAKALCERRCAELADFDTDSELNYVTQILGYRHGGTDVWVDGKFIHGEWQWTTSGHVVHSSLQTQHHHHDHDHNTYCGYIAIAPYDLRTSHNKLTQQTCSVYNRPLCEIKHVNN